MTTIYPTCFFLQVKFCKKNPGFMDSVRLGAVHAIDECQYQFSARRWNCSTLQEYNNKQVNFIKAQLGSKMADIHQLSDGLAALGNPGLSTSSVYSRSALAAPSWCPAAIQPKTIGPSRSPKVSVARRTVGGTVAIQSRS